MANIYVRSTDGSNSDDGSTWALAKLDLAGAAAIDNAGDTIYVSDNHAESTAGSIAIALAGTLASPTRIICGDDSAEPPTAVATSGTVTTTSSGTMTFTGAAFYVYGLRFDSHADIFTSNTSLSFAMFENCVFSLTNSASSSPEIYAVQGTSLIFWRDVDVRFSNSGQGLAFGGRVTWRGGGLESGTTSPTSLIKLLMDSSGNARSGHIILEGLDLSAGGSGMHIINGGASNSVSTDLVQIRNCKLPASWSGSLITGTQHYMGLRAEMYNCDDGDTNYALWVEDYSGSIRDETTIVRDGGASDGTTSFSWKMATTANAEYPLIVLRSPEIRYWNETTGSAITLTVEVVHDSQGSGTSSAFTDKEIWLEAQYLGTSGFPLGSFIDDAAADVLASAADQTSSSVSWTTTGLSTPVKQKLSVTLTPQEKGIILLTVCMAGASDTCYVCPKVTVS